MATEGSSNQTIYIQNISEKLKKEELTRTLYHIFSYCGEILEVNTRRASKYRGQAWITFNDIGAAVRAVKEMNNRVVYGKPLRIFFSKNKADIIAKADGTYVPRDKRTEEKKTEGAAKGGLKRKHAEDGSEEQAAKVARVEEEDIPPNKMLLASNLPPNITQTMLTRFFENAPGFLGVTIPEGGLGVAFVEFEDEVKAGESKEVLNGYKLGADMALKLQFAK